MEIPETESSSATEWQCPKCEAWNQVFASGYDGRTRCPECMSVVEGHDVDTRPLEF